MKKTEVIRVTQKEVEFINLVRNNWELVHSVFFDICLDYEEIKEDVKSRLIEYEEKGLKNHQLRLKNDIREIDNNIDIITKIRKSL